MDCRIRGNMGSRISDVLYIIDRVKVLDGHFRINQHQCKRLVGFYNRLGQILHQLREYVSHQTPYSLPSFDAVISVLQKGQILLEKYTKEDWFESMVTAGVNQDSFVAIHVELEACIRSIYAEVVKYQGLASLAQVPLMNLEIAEPPLLFLDEDDRASLFVEDAEVAKVEGLPSSTQVSLMNLETVAPLLSLDDEVRATLFKGDAEKDKKYMLEKIESMKIATKNARNTNITMKQKASEIRSLDMASEKISETNDQQTTAEITRELPSYLRIESSEIKLLDHIGSGGSAEVYKCRWLHCEYAVKIFRSGDVVGLRKEVENLITLRHPNIVLLVGFSIRESDLCPMVVMELLDCDLRSLIQTDFAKVTPRKRWTRDRETTISKSKVDPFPVEVAIDFIYQIATGMAYIHNKRLFHGDLKALNVLVKRHQAGSNVRNRWQYELKISDFGVSDKLVLKESHTGCDSDCTSFTTANVGSTRWRAPEVFDATDGDLKPYSMKADVYSFAMTCVEILTGQVPFHYLPTKEIRKHVQAGRRPHLPLNVPENLQKLIIRC